MTRIYLGLAAINLLYLLVGYAFLYAAGLARRRRDLRLFGLAYLVGWALLGSVLAYSLMAGISIGPAAVVVIAAVVTAVCVLVGRRTREVAPAPLAPVAHPLARLAAGLGAAALVLALGAALFVNVNIGWDTHLDLLTAWLPRAEIIFHWHSLNPAVWNSFSCPWYPPLAPTMYGVNFQFVGGFHPSLLPFQQTLLGIAFILAVLGLLDRFTPRWISLPSLALVVSAPWFWWRLGSLLPDQTNAYLIVVAALACVIWLRERHPAWLGLGVVFLTAAALTKLEGVVFGAVLVAATVVAGLVHYRRAGASAFVLLLGPAALLPWHLWLGRHHVASSTPDYNAPQLTSPSFLAHRIHRFTHAIDHMLRAPFQTEQITAVIVVVAIGVLLVVASRLPLISAAVGAWLVVSFLGLAAIYWTVRVPIDFYLSTSASRVGTTLIIAAGVLTPLLLGLALRSGADEDGG